MSKQGSSLRIYRRAAEIRQKKEFQKGHVTFSVVNDNVVSYLRHVPDCQSSAVYLVAVNVGQSASTDNYEEKVGGRSYNKGVVVLDTESADRADSLVYLKSLTLTPGQAVVLKLAEKVNDEL